MILPREDAFISEVVEDCRTLSRFSMADGFWYFASLKNISFLLFSLFWQYSILSIKRKQVFKQMPLGKLTTIQSPTNARYKIPITMNYMIEKWRTISNWQLNFYFYWINELSKAKLSVFPRSYEYVYALHQNERLKRTIWIEIEQDILSREAALEHFSVLEYLSR